MARLIVDVSSPDGRRKVSRHDFRKLIGDLYLAFERGDNQGSGEFVPIQSDGSFKYNYTWSLEGDDLLISSP